MARSIDKPAPPGARVAAWTNDRELVAALGVELRGAAVQCDHCRVRGDARSAHAVALLDVDALGAELEGAARHARSRNPRVLLVAIGADPDKDRLVHLMRLGAYDFVERPADVPALASKLRRLCERSERSRTGRAVSPRSRAAGDATEQGQVELHREVVRSNEELQALNLRLHKVVAQLRTLYHMGRDLGENENWSDALDRFLMALVGFMEAEGSALLLFSDEGTVLKPRSVFQMEPNAIESVCARLVERWSAHPRGWELHPLEGYDGGTPRSCLESTAPWRITVIPLRHRSHPLGFLILDKAYADGFAFKWDYDFLNTLQTIFVEEIANASYISELRRLGRFNNKVLDNIQSGVVTTDLEGNVRYCNVWAMEMCPRLRGLRRRRPSGVHFDSLFRSREVPLAFFAHIIASASEAHVLEVSCDGGADEPFAARLRATKMYDDNLDGMVVVAIFEDLTEQKRMEREIRRNDRLRALGQLSAGVAHEIRNPLTGIATSAEILGGKLAGDEEKSKYTRAMLAEINRLDGIVRNLLTFARPPRPRVARCAIAEVTERVRALVVEQAQEKGVALDFSSIDEDLTCDGDAGQLTQVLLNLVINAVQACGGGDVVRVQARRTASAPAGSSGARIEVMDTGPGVPPDIRESLFEPFVTTKTQGTGLGLAISQQIVEDHGGRIHCEFLDRGTRFTVELPLHTDQTAAARDGAAAGGA